MEKIQIYKLDKENKALNTAYIKSLPPFCHIQFSLYNITHNTVFLLQNIHLNKNIKSLDLSRNAILSDECLIQILAFSLENSSIQNLNLSFCGITDASLSIIARCSENLNISSLNLSFNNLTHYSSYSVHKLLSECKNLNHLDICFNKNLCNQMIGNLTGFYHNHWDYFYITNEVLKLNFVKFGNNNPNILNILNNLRANNSQINMEIESKGGVSIYTLYLALKELINACEEDREDQSAISSAVSSQLINESINSDEIADQTLLGFISSAQQESVSYLGSDNCRISQSSQNSELLSENISSLSSSETDSSLIGTEDVFGYLESFV